MRGRERSRCRSSGRIRTSIAATRRDRGRRNRRRGTRRSPRRAALRRSFLRQRLQLVVLLVHEGQRSGIHRAHADPRSTGGGGRDSRGHRRRSPYRRSSTARSRYASSGRSSTAELLRQRGELAGQDRTTLDGLGAERGRSGASLGRRNESGRDGRESSGCRWLRCGGCPRRCSCRRRRSRTC